MRNVLDIAMEAELGSLFVICQIGSETRRALTEMGHDQPPNPTVTDSATREGFENDNIRQ